MSYLDMIEYFMDLGYNEEEAEREAFRECFPDTFEAEDWSDTY